MWQTRRADISFASALPRCGFDRLLLHQRQIGGMFQVRGTGGERPGHSQIVGARRHSAAISSTAVSCWSIRAPMATAPLAEVFDRNECGADSKMSRVRDSRCLATGDAFHCRKLKSLSESRIRSSDRVGKAYVTIMVRANCRFIGLVSPTLRMISKGFPHASAAPRHHLSW
jgi:hypothetical protein